MILKSLIIVIPLALVGCPTGVSVAPKATDFRPLPPEYRRKCDSPVDIPDKELPQSEIETLWGQDRTHLSTCGSRHNKMVRYFDKVTGENVK